jgi:hypothetical protein
MKDNHETFCQRKLSSKNSIKKDNDNEKCQSEETSLPKLRDIGFVT